MARMAEMAVVASDRERKAKADMKRFYDRSVKAKTFCEGEMVLVRKPGLHSKMGDSWEGPYQIGKITPVTYRIEVPDKPSKQKLLHCNMLRRWNTPASKIHRIVAITEEESECDASPGLRQAGLTANVKKCQWGHTRCEFLGHIVGNGTVSPAEGKIEAVRSFVQPKTKKQIRQFLGLTGYYRRFIGKYAEHTFHMTEATRKSAAERVVWSNIMIDEFWYLKDCLCSIPSLTLPLASGNFVLQTDASQVGLGAVLSVREVERSYLLPSSPGSSNPGNGDTLPQSWRVWWWYTVDHFNPYLITHPFVVEADHRALVFLNSAQHTNGRLAIWAMRLQPYALSRLVEEDASSSETSLLTFMDKGTD